MEYTSKEIVSELKRIMKTGFMEYNGEMPPMIHKYMEERKLIEILTDNQNGQEKPEGAFVTKTGRQYAQIHEHS